MEIILIVLAVIVALFLITFAIYWFNMDMKLVRVIYEWLQKHYDKLHIHIKPIDCKGNKEEGYYNCKNN